MTQKFDVDGMGCSACVAAVEKAVKGLKRIQNVSVSLLENAMTVSYDENTVSSEDIINAVVDAGYEAKESSLASFVAKKPEESVFKKRFIPSLCFLIPLIYLNMAEMLNLPYPRDISGYLQCILSLAILIINRIYFIRGYNSIVHKAAGMGALISIGAGVSFIYSVYLLITGSKGPFYFESAGMIFTMITLGKSLEANSKAHTMDAINELAALIPETVSVLIDGKEEKKESRFLLKGETVIIRAGECIPVDGKIIKGAASLDKSALTGESLPEDAKEGDFAVSGSKVLDGYLYIEAEKTGVETTLFSIIEMVKEAASKKTPVEKLADKISGFFVPVVLSISLVTFLVWFILEKDFEFALNMAISVVVVACPCALGLATPTAVMAGTGNAAGHGILIRSGECLETAKNVTTVVLDKTGTVTEGELSVEDIVFEKEENKELLLKVASLEATSGHPYAKAIVSKIGSEWDSSLYMNMPSEKVEYVSGQGMQGVVNGQKILCGNEKLLSAKASISEYLLTAASEYTSKGKTVLFFTDMSDFGFFVISDSVKKDSREAVEKLKNQGIKVVLLTGDNKETAEAIAKEVGIDEVYSEVLPQQKHGIIEKLMEKGEVVAMVGDGINDAPSLAKADVGIAVGSGTQIAMDSADYILMKDSLLDVSYALNLSKRVFRTIRQNLFWAFIYNCIGIALAAGVFFIPFGIKFTPIISALCMSLSSLFVVTNALRLRK